MLTRLSKPFLIVAASIVSVAGSSYASTDINGLESFLHRFHDNPNAVMDELPYQVTASGQVLFRGRVDFNDSNFQLIENIEKHIDSQTWVLEQSRLPIFSNAINQSTMSAPAKDDLAQQIVHLADGQKLISNIETSAAQGLNRGETEFPTWSDSYWPMYKGIIGRRYADPAFPEHDTFFQNYTYINYAPAQNYIPGRINQLSPAEKYDLLIGDPTFSLGQFVWEKGAKVFREYGKVAHWQGICHGWAAASHFNVPIPQGAITVQGVRGDEITFYSSDIKGLISYLWAVSSPSTRFVGNRCRVTDPEKDEVGRITDQNCFDNNPATWHISTINQIGVNKQSFVMDSTYDSEVWNYPVMNYKITYFNPQTFQPSQDPTIASIPLSEYQLDKFRSYRAPETRNIVGVAMDVTHPVPAEPRTGNHGVEPLQTKTIRYVYDLELDDNMNIIGGEWYSNIHPDFIWTFEKDGRATAAGDLKIPEGSSWMAGQPFPEEWVVPATENTSRGRVLRHIVDALVEMSRSAGDQTPAEGTDNPEVIE